MMMMLWQATASNRFVLSLLLLMLLLLWLLLLLMLFTMILWSWSLNDFSTSLVQIVDKVASWTIRAKTNGMICSAQICFVFWMSGHSSQFSLSMRKLTFFTIFTGSMFRKWSAQLRLVSASVDF